MSSSPDSANPQPWVIAPEELQTLFDLLKAEGYEVVGPRIQQETIVYDKLISATELPVGWTDRQDAGTYRLEKRTDEALFGYAVGAHSWKKYLFPPQLLLWRGQREGQGFSTLPETKEPPKLAFIGVRACELHAIQIQDRVFLGGQHIDPYYESVREKAFLVAVNCGTAGGTCFCTSMGTGPEVKSGFDLALTEVVGDSGHYLLGEAGSEKGAALAARLNSRIATDEELTAGRQVVERTAGQMGRTMNTTGIKDLLYRNYENPQWDKVAERCLTCANCTMVCPTCFCHSVEDTTDLTGQQAERTRNWDSCFTLNFSYIHGGSGRSSNRSRYRQWLTHKLGTWHDQFGSSGCVGCGRCITWCPVGIDITQEIDAIRASEASPENGDETGGQP